MQIMSDIIASGISSNEDRIDPIIVKGIICKQTKTMTMKALTFLWIKNIKARARNNKLFLLNFNILFF